MTHLGSAFIYLIAINSLTYLSYALDKRRAIAGDWRFPESTLLLQALIGGSVGAKLAQRRLRHKARKQPFAGQLDVFVGLHILILVWLGVRALGVAPAIGELLAIVLPSRN